MVTGTGGLFVTFPCHPHALRAIANLLSPPYTRGPRVSRGSRESVLQVLTTVVRAPAHVVKLYSLHPRSATASTTTATARSMKAIRAAEFLVQPVYRVFVTTGLPPARVAQSRASRPPFLSSRSAMASTTTATEASTKDSDPRRAVSVFAHMFNPTAWAVFPKFATPYRELLRKFATMAWTTTATGLRTVPIRTARWILPASPE